jgi:hypothetical protein
VIFNTLLVLVNGLLGMIFEHSPKKKHLKYSLSGFSHLFQLCFHIAQGHIPNYIVHLIDIACHLTIVKLFDGGVLPYLIWGMFYHLVSTICLQFHDSFLAPLFPHQFGVS